MLSMTPFSKAAMLLRGKKELHKNYVLLRTEYGMLLQYILRVKKSPIDIFRLTAEEFVRLVRDELVDDSLSQRTHYQHRPSNSQWSKLNNSNMCGNFIIIKRQAAVAWDVLPLDFFKYLSTLCGLLIVLYGLYFTERRKSNLQVTQPGLTSYRDLYP